MNRLLSFVAVFVLLVLLLGRAVDQEFAQAGGLREGEPEAVAGSPVSSAGTSEPASPSRSLHYEQVRRIICVTFGPECAKAQRVAWCESRFNVHAVGNRYGADPYWGLFQFGSYARRTYGFGWDARTQARAAKRMRDREGWRPWPVCGRR